MTIASKIYRKLTRTLYRARYKYWLYNRFGSPLGYLRYRQSTSHAPVNCWVPKVPVPLLCRPGTTDIYVLWHTFSDSFHHLPPKPLPDEAVIVDIGANVGYTAVCDPLPVSAYHCG
jgi:hypothetical protein